MANILVTERCVRSCPYCFAGGRMAEAEDDFLSFEDLVYLADLHVNAGERSFRLLGGEPTLHPRFADIVAYLLARGFHVQVFTSGIMSDARRDEISDVLAGVPDDRVSFTVNLNDPELSPPAERAQVEKFLTRFGPRCVPGFNIYRLDFSLDFILNDIAAFGMRPRLRLGMAHPVYGHDNVFIRPADMRAVAERLVAHFPVLHRHRVFIGFDCGFPLCRFTHEELGELFYLTEGKTSFGCNPALDVGPDGSCWACFPLYGYYRQNLFDFNSLPDMVRHYEDLFRRVRVEVGGIYEDCDHCPHRETGLCRGGCLAHALNLMRDEPEVRKLKKP